MEEPSTQIDIVALKEQAAKLYCYEGQAEMADLMVELGTGDIIELDGERVDVYSIKKRLLARYRDLYLELLLEKGILRVLDTVHEDDCIIELEKRIAFDRSIKKAREQLAEIFSAGDETLHDILERHLHFNNGKIEPVVKQDTAFFQVLETRGAKAFEASVHGRLLKCLDMRNFHCTCGKCEKGEYFRWEEEILAKA